MKPPRLPAPLFQKIRETRVEKKLYEEVKLSDRWFLYVLLWLAVGPNSSIGPEHPAWECYEAEEVDSTMASTILALECLQNYPMPHEEELVHIDLANEREHAQQVTISSDEHKKHCLLH